MEIHSAVKAFMSELNRRKLNLHSVLITQDGNTLYEEYRAPFDADTPHRMYSVSKSFVAVGIGCLIDEGKLSLDSRIADFFPDKLSRDIAPEMRGQTVREMLIMNTCIANYNWFKHDSADRVKSYLAARPTKPAGSLFHYDSTGSFVLGALIERLSGKKLIDYLKLNFLNELGGFENAYFLAVPDGTAWGDSALLCTTRALERFARFVMNLGKWNRKQLVSRDFMLQATSFQSDTNLTGVSAYNSYGYGYQIWLTEQGGYSFHGMGGQHAIVMPKDRLIFAVTGDNQYNANYADTMYDAFFRCFYPAAETASPDAIPTAEGRAYSPFEARISGAKFVCRENPMGIKWFQLDFEGGGGTQARSGCAFTYENAQGVKRIPFGMNKNDYGLFPQLGYSDDRGCVHEINGFMYKCAASAAWREERKLFIRVQIIDRYFGSLHINIGSRDENSCAIYMVKAAEDFLDEYSGWAMGERKKQT
ncbi:MAG: serine hydrolase [Clostridia bacterium]|nr:serine hydrolase [Clostridia bacterium]